MAKITVCDYCKAEGVLKETNRYTRIRGLTFLDIAYCDAHEKDVPKKAVEHVRVSYKLNGVVLKETDDEIVAKFLTRQMRGTVLR